MNKGLLYNVVSVAIMSMSPLLSKFALQYANSETALVYNALFATAFALLYALLRRDGSLQQVFRARKYLGTLLLVGLTNACGVLFQFKSLELLSPVVLGLLSRLYVIFALVLGAVMFRERLSRTEVWVALTAIIGAFLWVYQGASAEVGSYLGLFFALLYTFLFALTNGLAKVASRECGPNTILLWNSALTAIALLLYGGLTGKLQITSVPAVGIFFTLGAAATGSFLGLLFFYAGLQHISFARANLIRTAGPVLVAAYSWPFFPVALTSINLVGGALLVGSVVSLAYEQIQLEKQAGRA